VVCFAFHFILSVMVFKYAETIF